MTTRGDGVRREASIDDGWSRGTRGGPPGQTSTPGEHQRRADRPAHQERSAANSSSLRSGASASEPVVANLSPIPGTSSLSNPTAMGGRCRPPAPAPGAPPSPGGSPAQQANPHRPCAAPIQTARAGSRADSPATGAAVFDVAWCSNGILPERSRRDFSSTTVRGVGRPGGAAAAAELHPARCRWPPTDSSRQKVSRVGQHPQTSHRSRSVR